MNIRHLALGGLILAGLAVPLMPFAQSPLSATPRYAPIGVASSGNTSTAWFHEAASGKAMACSAPTSGGGAIACTTVTLPSN